MITDAQRKELIEEFAELDDDGVIMQKEVYAHVGLLFFKFALIEHSLINILTLHFAFGELAAKRIRSKAEWEQAHDRGFEQAKQKTLGNLVRAVSQIPDFTPFIDELNEIKRHRDYFAHHFFREEVGFYSSDEGCWHLLWAIKQLRDQLVALDAQLSAALETMCERLGTPWPTEEVLQRGQLQIVEETEARIKAGVPFPWQKAGG